MKNLFNPDSLLFQFLTRVGDLIILNLLFILCSLPIVTMGASLAALYKVTIDMQYDNENGMFRGFFTAFRDNFKQATILWLIVLLVLMSLGCDWLLILTFGGGKIVYWLLGILAVLVLCVECYMFPLLVRYSNTLKEHFSNAVVLAVIKLPKTLAMVFLNLFPFIILWISVSIFIQTLIFWGFIGFAFVAYVQTSMLKGIFTQLEAGNDKVTVGK